MRRRKLILYYTSMKVKCETQHMISIRFPVHTYYFVHFIPHYRRKMYYKKVFESSSRTYLFSFSNPLVVDYFVELRLLYF